MVLHFLKKILLFRIGQKASRGFARAIGIGRPIAGIVGLIGGVKYMRQRA